MACADSVALPQAFSGGPYAARGSGIGAFVRRVLGGMAVVESAALEPEEWRATCLGLDFTRLCGDLSNVRGEMAYALDVNAMTVRELGSNLGRRYPAGGPSEIMGTNDVEGVRLGDVPVVIDLKSGQPVTKASENPQILFHAACRYLATGAPEIEGRIAYVSEDGAIDLDWATFDAFTLESFVDDLLTMTRLVADARTRLSNGGPTRVHAGEWCTYCGAMPSCPRYVALARSMAGDVESIASKLGAMTPDQQGIAWTKGKEIENLLEHVMKGLKALATQNPIPLPDGRVVRAMPWGTSSFHKAKAIELLRAHGAPEAEISALQVEGTTVQVRAVGKRKREV